MIERNITNVHAVPILHGWDKKKNVMVVAICETISNKNILFGDITSKAKCY